MAKVIDEKVKRLLEKKMTFFLKYFPVRIKNVGEDAVEARKLIWAFKDAEDGACEQVARMTADYIGREYGDRAKDIVLSVSLQARRSRTRAVTGGSVKGSTNWQASATAFRT